ncbi:hypothetical protein GTP56_13630 [Duganella sp. FT134W]|uniref:Uncharacterized protein n=1 Tax=Duganella margarita TaxID=2692170 RepID=A0A7X4H2R0_9BURK|nr:hypothetical protein [Duganella margarita]MYM73232.1 hypothetical protein [Duganella margarita]
MSTRKKNAEPPRHSKPKQVEPPPLPTIDINALLMVGEERVHIVYEEDDNVTFMAEVIDTR